MNSNPFKEFLNIFMFKVKPYLNIYPKYFLCGLFKIMHFEYEKMKTCIDSGTEFYV